MTNVSIFSPTQLGQAIRLMLSYAGEEFEEKKYTFGGGNNAFHL